MSENNAGEPKQVLEAAEPSCPFHLRLYVAGQWGKSIAAMRNLKRVCDQYLPGHHQIELIDLLQTPELAARDQIVAVPTLVRRLPRPLKRMTGTLSDTDKVRIGLDIPPECARTSRATLLGP